MNRQFWPFEDGQDTPHKPVLRSQQRLRAAIDTEEIDLLLEFVPASRLYDCEHGERVAYDWVSHTGADR